jgi:uncharacterized membrane protein
MRIRSVSHALFAATLIALGLLGLINGNFTMVWQPAQKGVSARELLTYLSAVIFLGSGISLLWERAAAPAARVLLGYLLPWLLWRMSVMFLAPDVGSSWAAGETAVMTASAWVLYIEFAADWDRRRLGFAAGESGLRIARVLYGLALIPFGLAHFVYLERTASLVPGSLPAHVAWAYLTGWTFIAASVAVLIGVYARLAVALSALQMGLFLLLAWVPVIATASKDVFQSGEIVATWALTAAAWVVADSYRGVPWLALDKHSRQ